MDEDIKRLALKTVEKADKAVRKIYIKDFHKLSKNIEIGADGTPTTYLDKVAEDAALSCIEKSDVKVNVLSEEAGDIDFGGEYTFVLDPVDGTRNAYRGIPFFSVSLAVGKRKVSDIKYAVVKNIPTGDVFVAEKHHGAFLNNKRISVSDCPSKEIVSSLTLGKNIEPITQLLSRKDNVRTLGACSLEMCLVATGALDFYVAGREYIRVIDLAAGTLIVREAGGFVKNIKGKELDMNFSLHERTSVVATCTEGILKSICSSRTKS